MEIGALIDLLDAGRYTDCREAAEVLIRHGNLSPVEKAQVFLALSDSLAAMQSKQKAIGPGELAAHFCRETHQYDLLGRTLYHLGSLYHEVRLDKRALSCLQEYFRYVSLYRRARALEGRILHQMALCHRVMGRSKKALEYFRKALNWQRQHEPDVQRCERYRADLIRQHLQLVQAEPSVPLLSESHAYVKQHPGDLQARAAYLNNRALLALTERDYAAAVQAASRVIRLRGVPRAQRAEAYLILFETARAMDLHREALGMGVLTRIQAGIARRPDIEDAVSRAIIQMQQHGNIPPVDELFRRIEQSARQNGAG